jgi:hypothetical protein
MENSNSNLWKILSFDKNDIFLYIIFSTVIIYIWKISNISINYLFPFIILCMIIYLKQLYLYEIDIYNESKLLHIKNFISKLQLNELVDNDIINILNKIFIYNTYNPTNYNLLLKTLNKFNSTHDIYTLHLCLKTYENFIYSLPIEALKDHYLNKVELTNILYRKLNDPKNKMIEMQSLIPYNFDINDYNYLI